MFKLFSRFYSKQKTEKKPDPPKKKSDQKRKITESTEDNLTYLECFQNNHEILKKFDILEKIGGGSFGQIFKVRDKSTSKIIAMKIEKIREGKQLMVFREYQIMKEFKNEAGFAKLHSYYKSDEYCYLVMTNLGPNLETLKNARGGSLSLKSTLMIGYEIMCRIQTFHAKNYLHRDIKPENFVIGPSEKEKSIYIIDFGLSRPYVLEDGSHIPFKDKKGMVGTARYVSINTHLGFEQSRRDDLESIGYILVYFCKGNLPWQNLPAKNKEEKYGKILEVKKKTSIEDLCRGLPRKFVEFFEYVKNLTFKTCPDYEYLKGLFISMMKENDFKINHHYDWVKSEEMESSMEIDQKMEDYCESEMIINKKHLDIDLEDLKLITAIKYRVEPEENSSKYINYNSSLEENEENIYTNNNITERYQGHITLLNDISNSNLTEKG